MAISDIPDAGTSALPRRAMRRNWFLFAAIVLMLGVSIWCLQLPVRLTVAESQLTGTWTFPLPPNPPPNAIQQIYEMRRDRTLVKYSKSVLTGIKIVEGKGTWGLDREMLVWKIAKVEYSERFRAFMDGRSSTYENRMRYLGVQGDSFFVEANNGSKAALIRFSNGP